MTSVGKFISAAWYHPLTICAYVLGIILMISIIAHFRTESAYCGKIGNGIGNNEYAINNLRPKETKWLGASILVKPLSSTVKLSYLIKSSNSNGELDGEIIIEI